MPQSPPPSLNVLLNDALVGRLVRTPDGRIAFSYTDEWLQKGFSISPLSFPLEEGVFIPEWEPFGGLHGVFFDSLPDGWGALLLDRALLTRGVDPASMGPLARLAIVGSSGRGGLRYEPEQALEVKGLPADLDSLAAWSSEILDNKPIDDLDVVYAAAGSSGGARPKAFYTDEEGDWIVKFPSRLDPENICELEYKYMGCAEECGIEVPPVKLIPSKQAGAFFAIKRFDIQEDGSRIHMLSASALLEVSHRVPALDYIHLFQLSRMLTQSKREDERLFRLMCFNVFAHNYDDHSNNFTWTCSDGVWRLSPAYDLTYSTSYGNEHATTVLGQGVPGMAELIELAEQVGLNRTWAKDTAANIADKCAGLLAAYGLSGS